MLSDRVPRAAEPNAWAKRLAERKARGLELLDLTESNPTRVGLPSLATSAREAFTAPGSEHYEPEPRGLPVTREAIARYYADHGAQVDAGDVVVTSGTSEAYAHLFRLLCDPGERVLAPRPSYPLFEPLAAAEGIEIGFYDWREERGWRLDLGSFEQAIDARTCAAITVQPHHPTGCGLHGSELAAFEAICARHGLAVISDEVFVDYGRPGTPSLTLSKVRAVPTFVLSGLSKVCGLPQMKLSWIVAAGPDPARARAVEGLEWLADLFLSVSTPVQLAAPRWLADRQVFQTPLRERLAENLEILHATSARGSGLSVLEAQGGWVAILRMSGPVPPAGWEIALLDRGVVVHPGYFYDLADESCVVVSLIVEPATVRHALSRIEALVSA